MIDFLQLNSQLGIGNRRVSKCRVTIVSQGNVFVGNHFVHGRIIYGCPRSGKSWVDLNILQVVYGVI